MLTTTALIRLGGMGVGRARCVVVAGVPWSIPLAWARSAAVLIICDGGWRGLGRSLLPDSAGPGGRPLSQVVSGP